MPRCGCASDTCSCTVMAGTGITISGSGTDQNPYVIEVANPGSFLTVVDTGSVDLTLTGTGGENDPYVLSAVATFVAPSVSLQTFTTSGTWSKTAGKSIAKVTCIGGGGGGGAGRRGDILTQRSGGGGGGGGGFSITDFYFTALAASETVTVGTGGTGASGQSVDNTNGDSGTSGGDSSFGLWLRAGGGQPGPGGDDGTTGDPTPAPGGFGHWLGGAGARTLGGSAEPALDRGSRGGTGGGAGGSLDATNTVLPASAGGASLSHQLTGGAAAAATGGGGGAGTAGPADGYCGGTGGGGGGAGSPGGGTGGSGGNGAVAGGGGGGGGGCLNGSTSGAGGAGGAGRVFVAVT